MEKITAADALSAGLHARSDHDAHLEVHGRYTAVCRGADGSVKWSEEFDNLVTTAGKNSLLDNYLGNTAPGIAYLGLKGTGTAAAADTSASHAGWTEVGGANAPVYSASTRPTPAFSAATNGSKGTSTAVSFSFTSAGTVAGAFLNIGASAKDATTGVLYSAGDFGTARTVASGDSLAVTYTASA